MIQLIILKNLIFYHLNVLFEVKQKNIDSVATYNVAVGRFAEHAICAELPYLNLKCPLALQKHKFCINGK